MAVYVDNYDAPFRSMIMCHMMADTHEELMDMARRIGVQQKWLQHPGKWSEHFDICKSKRLLAVRYGAVELSPKDLVSRFSPRQFGTT